MIWVWSNENSDCCGDRQIDKFRSCWNHFISTSETFMITDEMICDPLTYKNGGLNQSLETQKIIWLFFKSRPDWETGNSEMKG
jgi:hypothetical protein